MGRDICLALIVHTNVTLPPTIAIPTKRTIKYVNTLDKAAKTKLNNFDLLLDINEDRIIPEFLSTED